MTTDPRAALDRLIAALEAHFDAVANRRSELDPRIEDTYDLLADAFEVYDDALNVTYNEYLPFAIDEDEDDEFDSDEPREIDPDEIESLNEAMAEIDKGFGGQSVGAEQSEDVEVLDPLDDLTDEAILEAEELED